MIRLAINTYPFLSFFHDGPKVFMNRLTNAFIKNKLFKVRSVYLPNYDCALFSVMNTGFFKKPYFLRLDGLYIDSQNTVNNSEIENQKIFESISSAKALIYQSHYCKKITEVLFVKKIAIPSIVINNGVPLNIFSPCGNNFRKKFDFSSQDRILITSAHWRRHKRLEETIKLIDILNENRKTNYKLIVLGKTSHLQLKKKKNIIFSGEIHPNKLANWYRTADVYLHLAWIEPAGNTQNEAMACGLPVICSNNGGLKDTVISANGGIISNTDAKYQFDKINYYNPPEPNYQNLKKDIESVFNNLSYFKSNINYSAIDINVVAIKYANFIKKNFQHN